MTPSALLPDIKEAIRQAEQQLEAIAAVRPEKATYENTYGALEAAARTVGRPWGRVSDLEGMVNTPALREAHAEAQPLVTRFFTSITFNQPLWEALRRFGESEAAKALEPVYLRHVEEVMADFREAGADLPQAKKDRLIALEEELSKLTSDFQNNALDAINAFELLITDPARLAGLPESAIEAAREDARVKGHGSEESPVWRFTLQAPSYLAVMRHADDEALRREIWQAYGDVAKGGEFDNYPVVQRILTLRHEKAQLLGKPHFADVVLARRMAKSGAEALQFVKDLEARTQPAFRREIATLEDFKAKQTGATMGPLKPWEIAYWSEKMRRAQCGFDPEALRPYFSVDAVLGGLFELCEEVFGISVVEIKGEAKPETWHPEVGFYELRDRQSGRHLGSFYTDWHPRETKRSGAWLSPMSSGERQADGLPGPHLGVMCGNLTKPVGGKPALLTHDEVETVFHEFGHCLHHLLSEVPVPSLSGTSVAWDFVELPSQIMENWTWERSGLDRFARHYQTGEALPEELFEQLLQTRTFQAAIYQIRQLSFGLTDLSLHMEYAAIPEAERPELESWWRELNANLLMPVDGPPARSNLTNFGHLFSNSVGYAAGYYSYKWAEVLEADAFTRFLAEGITNAATGAAFRSTILARGNSAEPDQLFRDFMGRDPDPEALLRRLDLVPA
jgi:oligopeptidase A